MTRRRVAICACPSVCPALLPGVTDEAVEVAGPHSLSARDAGIQLFQDAAGDLARTLGAIENDDVAVGVGVDAEAILDQARGASCNSPRS